MGTRLAVLGALVLSVVRASAVSAQVVSRETPRVLVGAQVASVSSGQFDARESGAGVLAGVRWLDGLWVEGTLLRYPGAFAGTRPFSQSRVEALFGVSAGPSLGRLRPFARVGAGVLRMNGAGGPVACILIFPPPLSCTLATGRTLPAWEVGGGLMVTPGQHVFGRVDVGARTVRYPGPSIDGQRHVHDGAFRATDPRLAVSAGVRF